ncbi:hypothetical protein [Agrococcus beijingensis]|uniref:hypothetical protein n=1 Tax=Agrococcus beijingensis TaxID=3068634 RepID=UPI0027418778|nr:hypothetical protein [Agrococcus sp. REN33]
MPDRANGKYVSNVDALAVWWPAARETLLEVSRDPGARISEQQLAERIQAATGVSTRQPASEWIGRVLDRVASDAESRGEQSLTSLCTRPSAEPARRTATRSTTRATPRASAPKAPPAAVMRETTCPHCFMVVPTADTCRECGGALAA